MIEKRFINFSKLVRKRFLFLLLLTCLLIPFVKAHSQISSEISIVQGVYGDAVGQNKYVPGSTINVAITFNKNTSETITALGCTCLLPYGWQYQGGTNQPPIAPRVGTSSDGVIPLEFAWLIVPTFPFTLTFNVSIPLSAQGPGQIQTQALYRLTGEQLYSNIETFNFTGEYSGTLEGTPEGEGVVEGTPEGVPEGTPEGTLEGTPEGVVEGTHEGTPEGTAEGVVEGTPEGTLEGTPEGEGEPSSNKVTVPSVVGKTEAESRFIITSAGLVVGKVTQEYSKDVPKGKVIRQAPTAGSQVDPGTAVDLVISKGAKRRFIISCGSGSSSDSSHIGDMIALGLVSGLLLLRWRKVTPFMNN